MVVRFGSAWPPTFTSTIFYFVTPMHNIYPSYICHHTSIIKVFRYWHQITLSCHYQRCASLWVRGWDPASRKRIKCAWDQRSSALWRRRGRRGSQLSCLKQLELNPRMWKKISWFWINRGVCLLAFLDTCMPKLIRRSGAGSLEHCKTHDLRSLSNANKRVNPESGNTHRSPSCVTSTLDAITLIHFMCLF